MTDWFTVEPIDNDTFALSEYRHWEEPHSYLLLGESRALLIDSGLGVGNIRQVVEQLTSLPVTVALTHAHWDHMGGLSAFEDIAVHQEEAPWLTGHFPLPLAAVKANLTRQPCDFPPDFDPDTYQLYQGEPQRLLADGDWLDLGGRCLQVLHTPGHSPGHCCFYEPQRQLLFAGDLIYAGCLDMFYPSTDPLQFYRSIQRVAQLPVKKLLPGHHQLHLSSALTAQIAAAFAQLEQQGSLRQGAGLFDFGPFQLHL